MKQPVALTIAGSDSCAGAGLQADLRVFAALGVSGVSVVAAVTAQNAKRVRAVLDACTSLEGPYRLLIGGEFSTPEYETALAPRFESDRVIRRPYLDDAAFERVLGATDIGVNLRFPSAGETSGLVMRMMSLGKPVLVTGSDESSAFPDNAVIRVDSGEAETEMLRAYLQWLIEEPEIRARIGQSAAAHVNGVHSLSSVAERYGEILRHSTTET